MQFKNLEEIQKYLSNDKHYTPTTIVDLISARIKNVNFENKIVLETSVGEANIISQLITNNPTMKKATFIICDVEENNINFAKQRSILENEIPEKNIIVILGNTLEKIEILKNYEIDYCFQNPPFGIGANIDKKYFAPLFKKETEKVSKIESCFWDLAMRISKNSFSILPVGCLFRSGWESKVIENNLDNITNITLLPSNMFATTSIPVVLCESNQNNENNFIKISDVTDLCVSNTIKYAGKNQKVNQFLPEHVEAINELINNTNDCQIGKKISHEIIKQNKYNLNITRYVQRVVEEEKNIDEISKNLDEAISGLVNLENQIKKDLGIIENYDPVVCKPFVGITKIVKDLLK